MVTQRMEHGASYRADLEPRLIQDNSPGSELSNGAIQSFRGAFYGSVCSFLVYGHERSCWVSWWPRWCTDQQKQPEQPGSSLEAQRSLGIAQRRQEKPRRAQEKPQSEYDGEPGSEQKCSTSLPGGNLVDGLPPALNSETGE